MPSLWSLMNDEWTQLTSTSATRAEWKELRSTIPLTHLPEDLAELPEWDIRALSDDSDTMLRGLLEAGTDLANRAVLQCLVPLLVTSASRFGHSVRDDIPEILVAATWRVIACNQTPAYRIADLLVRSALRDTFRAFRREQGNEVPIPPDNNSAWGLADETLPETEDLIVDRLEINELLSTLSPMDREIVIRHYLADTPQAEVAALMGCTTDAVLGRCKRARARLRLAGSTA